jgi:hypothetical protein
MRSYIDFLKNEQFIMVMLIGRYFGRSRLMGFKDPVDDYN